MPDLADLALPSGDEDAALLGELAAVPLRPVFIMGLHRSGTTFLYDCMARAFPLAHLGLYQLFYYDRLLKNQRDGGAAADRARLNTGLAARGIQDRLIDRVAIDADAVEEYGFWLRRRSGSFRLSAGNAACFSELCKKLLRTQPGSQAVLLKNPWDTGNAAEILRLFPDARFVYISREPMAVLNSLLNALLSYLDGPQDYLELLLSVDGSRRGYRAGYVLWRGLRWLRQLLGPRAIARLFRRPLAAQTARQFAVYRAELKELPAAVAIELDYSQLASDPAAVMQRLQAFLALPLGEGPLPPAAAPRNNLQPVLQGYQGNLDALIRRARRVGAGPLKK